MPQTLLLKKYANRRLYDTEKSAYITLSQLSEIIRKGRQVKVIDAKTEEDVTAFILTQVIVEEARRNNSLLPVTLLHLIIQYGGNVLAEFFDKYLEVTIRNYLAYRSALDQQFRNWLEMGRDLLAHTPPPPSPFSTFESILEQLSHAARGTGKEPPGAE